MGPDEREILMRPNRTFALTALCAFTIATAGAAGAAGTANTPAGLDTARKAFAAAVAARDLKGIVALSGFPIAVEMYGYAPTIGSKQFLSDKRKFADLFGAPDENTVHCIAAGNMERQNDRKQFGFGSWSADCNGNEYFFTLRNGRWLFTGYENINE
jgi:hypothetical protein